MGIYFMNNSEKPRPSPPIQRRKGIVRLSPGYPFTFNHLVGATGFEPATPCSQSRCATRLRHAPKKNPRHCGAGKLWGERWDLNPRPPGPQPGALPTELLPPREDSYTQVFFLLQAFFPHTSIWILSRKITTLPKVACAQKNAVPQPSKNLHICKSAAPFTNTGTGNISQRQTYFGDTHGQTGYRRRRSAYWRH